jgi:transposase
MSARHRVTHLLLRQGIVYSGGTPWTRVHENWLHIQRFPRPALQVAYDAALEALAAPRAAGIAWIRPSRRWPPTADSPR